MLRAIRRAADCREYVPIRRILRKKEFVESCFAISLCSNQKPRRTDEPAGMDMLKRFPPKTGVPAGE